MIMMHRKRRAGFTLVELIIVIVILGILGTIAIPQFINSTKDASDATVTSDLTVMRNAVNLYYHQHNSIYPGQNKTDGTTGETAANAPTTFVSQMTQYSDKTGKVSATMNRALYPYGPYLASGIPTSPINSGSTVKIVDTQAAILAADVGGADGWAFNRNTGEVRVNDSTKLTQ